MFQLLSSCYQTPETVLQLQQIDVSLQANTRPRVTAPDAPLAFGTSLLPNAARPHSQDADVDTAGATSVMEARLPLTVLQHCCYVAIWSDLGPQPYSSSSCGHCANIMMFSLLQAQESGEQFEIQDNVVYALDGLTSSASPAVRRESAAKIAEVCASQRGRLALRRVSHARTLPAVPPWIDSH